MSVETVWASGQKEMRIIDALEPVIGFHKLIVNTQCLTDDVNLCQKYPAEHRPMFSWLFQMKYITRDRGSLIHDDRLESLSQGVSHLIREIKSANPGHTTPPVTDKFKGFKKEAGMWKFAHRCTGQDTKPINNLMDRFKR